MKLKQSLRNVFRNEEGLFDLSTTDMDKTIEFAKGDFKRFNKGGPVTSAYYTPPSQVPTETSDYASYIPPSQLPQNRYKDTGFMGAPPTDTSSYYSPKAPDRLTTAGPTSGYYDTNYGSRRPSFAPASEPSVWERLKAGAEDIFSRENVEKAISNIIKKHKEKVQEGGAPDPFENMKKFKDSAVRARATAGAQFTKGMVNSPITKDLASAFNPNVSPSLAKFLMANMGTQGVATKGLPTYTSRISVRRPKYTSGAVTPQEVNFRLPTRSA